MLDTAFRSIPQKQKESGAAGHECIGTISSLYFTLYAVGQLINGIIIVSAKKMIADT